MTDRATWRLRARTVRAIGQLVCARIALAALPFALWRGRLGAAGGAIDTAEAARLANHVCRAARHLPFEAKCLIQAMALSWQLRRCAIAHQVTLAVRPHGERGRGDDLHAWVTVGEQIVLGELSGPWIEVLVLPVD